MGRGRQNPYARPDQRTRSAKAAGYPARSVFKLEEIDRRVRLLRAGQHVLDLGAAPGSWSKYVAERIGPSGRLLAVDLEPLAVPLPAFAEALCGDVLTLEPAVLERLAPYDVVLSDMAPRTARQAAHAFTTSVSALFNIDGSPRAGAGRITTTSTSARQIQLGLKLTF